MQKFFLNNKNQENNDLINLNRQIKKIEHNLLNSIMKNNTNIQEVFLANYWCMHSPTTVLTSEIKDPIVLITQFYIPTNVTRCQEKLNQIENLLTIDDDIEEAKKRLAWANVAEEEARLKRRDASIANQRPKCDALTVEIEN